MGNYTILVVEDEANMARLLEFQLRSAGYQVIQARDGQDGLQVAKEKHVDLILTDIMMPMMDGYELCRAVKQIPELWHIPVIMLSAKSDRASIIHGYAVGAARYLTTPLKREELYKGIDLRLKYSYKARAMLARKAKEWAGQLAVINVFTVLELFSIGGWTGRIDITNSLGQHGCLHIVEGSIQSCSLEGQTSNFNIFLVLSWEQGDFTAIRY
ncbi:MAG: response regulator [bacterium]|nr:response regulator [bacterium]